VPNQRPSRRTPATARAPWPSAAILFCALAVSADLLTLAMPSVVGALWRRRSPAVMLARALWCAGCAVTVANLAGYVGEHVEQAARTGGRRSEPPRSLPVAARVSAIALRSSLSRATRSGARGPLGCSLFPARG
jgi:hypothetical protein